MYAATEILHDPGYLPPGPTTELDPRRVEANFRGGGLTLTVIYHDDADPVPGVPVATLSAPGVPGEHARWPLPLSSEQKGARELRNRASAQLDQLQALIDGTSTLTNQQVIVLYARLFRRLILLETGDTDTPE